MSTARPSIRRAFSSRIISGSDSFASINRMLAALLANTAVKQLVRRPRPDLGPELGVRRGDRGGEARRREGGSEPGEGCEEEGRGEAVHRGFFRGVRLLRRPILTGLAS